MLRHTVKRDDYAPSTSTGRGMRTQHLQRVSSFYATQNRQLTPVADPELLQKLKKRLETVEQQLEEAKLEEWKGIDQPNTLLKRSSGSPLPAAQNNGSAAELTPSQAQQQQQQQQQQPQPQPQPHPQPHPQQPESQSQSQSQQQQPQPQPQPQQSQSQSQSQQQHQEPRTPSILLPTDPDTARLQWWLGEVTDLSKVWYVQQQQPVVAAADPDRVRVKQKIDRLFHMPPNDPVRMREQLDKLARQEVFECVAVLAPTGQPQWRRAGSLICDDDDDSDDEGAATAPAGSALEWLK
eukprot:TRINITY_DN701_c0_g1_i10.p1 TRINITY_DN701_c0_g1~~TRINITY_DN701_c0_g1_i10.p1  ORF type:complete len:343 (-),score=132.29 TRINITY_DN701_c0_g1_i10:54-935(-)